MSVSILEDVFVAYGEPVIPSSVFDIINTVREGLRYTIFQKIAKKMPFTMVEWSQYLHISDRTMLRYKNDNAAFDALQSDKIFQLSLLYDKGVEVFGEGAFFNIWLDTNNIALGGAKPKDLLDNSFGINLLNDELLRIEHGVLA